MTVNWAEIQPRAFPEGLDGAGVVSGLSFSWV